jgi:hypothetical protein
MKARSLVLLTAGLVPALTACGVAIRYGTYVSRDAELRNALTFAWNQEEDHAIGDPRLQGNRFFEDRLHEAIEWELSLRGIHLDESEPDLLVHHHLALEDHEFAAEVIDDAGYKSTEVYTYEAGNVVVHLVDAKTKRAVWIGWAQADIEIALRSPGNMREWVYRLVDTMFSSWPEATRALPLATQGSHSH